MGSKKAIRKRSPGYKKKVVDVPQVKLFAVITGGYIVLVTLLGLLFGATAAAILATPIWAFLYLVFSRWNRAGGNSEANGWGELVRFPKLNYLNIFAVILTISAVQFVIGVLFSFVDARMRPGFFYSGSDSITQAFVELFSDPRTLVVMTIADLIGCFAGGFVAGRLPNKKCPAPYRHAVIATIILNLINFSLVIPLLALSGEEDLPSSEDIGQMILATFPSYLFAAFGAWVAIRKRRNAGSAETSIAVSDKSANELARLNNTGKARPPTIKKHRRGQLRAEPAIIEEESSATPEVLPRKTLAITVDWLRGRRVTISICLVVTCLSVLGVWAFIRKYPKPVLCENAPDTATLNFWPVGYLPGIQCHENATVDARLVGPEYYYSRSLEEWERGLAAKKGDEIYVRIYISNGAQNDAEEINPGRGIARNVRLKTAIAQDSNDTHYVEVEFAGDNTNTVVSDFKITTGVNQRIEVIKNSGEVFNFTSTELISKDLDIGNNTILIGDLPPNQHASVYIRFRVRVVD